MSQKVEKVKKGRGRDQRQKSKSPKFKIWTFDKKGGSPDFQVFPNVNEDFKYFSWTKNKLVLKWFLGNFKSFKFFFFLNGELPKFRISNFSQIILGDRGSTKLWTFSTFCDFFFWRLPLFDKNFLYKFFFFIKISF